MSNKTNVCELSLIAVNLVDDQFSHHFCHDDKHLNNNNNNNINNNLNNNSITELTTNRLTTNPSGDVLGFVTLSSLSVKLNEFRNLMSTQIELLPQQFMFLSKEGFVF
jgi:hypothetical protein